MAFLSVPYSAGQLTGANFLAQHLNETYQIWQAHHIPETLHLWADLHPNLIRVTTSQERYGLMRAGTDTDCKFEEDATGCSNYIFTIQDFVAHPEGSRSSKILPELLWVGAIHGDDKLGVTVVMETASILLEAATCESKPRNVANEYWDEEVLNAQQCRTRLREEGIDDERRKWLARLVSTRRIVVVPALNALGFDRNERTEGSNDPDKDFPYIPYHNSSCMETIAARTVNEIFREHMFQITLSFDSGERNRIGYSWGSSEFGESWVSPDQKAQSSLAKAREIALGVPASGLEIGELNRFPSAKLGRGIMLDWAYASSWDSERLGHCLPTSFGGYSMEKVVYNNSTNRATALSVSTRFNESTDGAQLGSSKSLFHDNGKAYLVTRNMRLALASVDLVEPYVSIVAIGTTFFSDDLVPLTKRDNRQCQTTKAVAVPTEKQTRVEVEWTVGGGFNFSDVGIWYAKWDSFSEDELDCLFQPDLDVRSDPRFQKGQLTAEEGYASDHGNGAFSPLGPRPQLSKSRSENSRKMGPSFRAWLNLNDCVQGDQLVIIAGAKVDQEWARSPVHFAYGPSVVPQSHLINARTNAGWHHEIENGKTIRGRLDWYSTPVTIVLANYETRLGTMSLSDRFHRDSDLTKMRGKRKAGNKATFDRFWPTICAIIVVTLATISFFFYRHALWIEKTKKITMKYCSEGHMERSRIDTDDDSWDEWIIDAREENIDDDRILSGDGERNNDETTVELDNWQVPQGDRKSTFSIASGCFERLKHAEGVKHDSPEVLTFQKEHEGLRHTKSRKGDRTSHAMFTNENRDDEEVIDVENLYEWGDHDKHGRKVRLFSDRADDEDSQTITFSAEVGIMT